MRSRIWRIFLVILLVLGLASTGFFGYFIYTVWGLEDMPELTTPLATHFYYANGELLATRSLENRVEIPLAEMPKYVRQAIIAIEDERFYQHFGLDPIGIARAVWVNLQKGKITQGGSTITQQLARNLYLSHERTFSRKFQEAALTLQLERLYTKDEILEKFLNTIYFGRGAYGIETAAQIYFGKNARDLTLAEAAFLAGIPQRPSMSTERAFQRQEVVLRQMAKLGYINEGELQEALEEELVFYQDSSESNSQTRYFVDTVIYRELADLWSKDDKLDLLYQGGLKIYTTLDYGMQAAAEKAFEKLPDVARIDENGVRQPQGGLVAIDPATGHVKALIGGRDYKETQFNRAVDARRSPGSAFKPFVYAAALEQQGYTADTRIVCEPVTINIPGAAPYEPKDYGGTFHNRVLTLREALALSCNVAAIKTNIAVGPEQVAAFAARMGIKSPLEPVVSLPLGSSDVTVLEMVAAYTPFANKGIKVEPLLVTRVEDAKGNVLLENKTEQEVVLDEGIAFIITDVLRDVLRTGGTATSTAVLKDRPAAGKTGTAQNEKSVYMIGYTPDLVAAVYVGDDDQ
ncbi:MAG TPA: PBP1A family penicillin-binding protein, partial [Firmicutes bacterium]|nr:PBP1A family penicillin-binding protein [Bacillota bacterium]